MVELGSEWTTILQHFFVGRVASQFSSSSSSFAVIIRIGVFRHREACGDRRGAQLPRPDRLSTPHGGVIGSKRYKWSDSVAGKRRCPRAGSMSLQLSHGNEVSASGLNWR